MQIRSRTFDPRIIILGLSTTEPLIVEGFSSKKTAVPCRQETETREFCIKHVDAVQKMAKLTFGALALRQSEPQNPLKVFKWAQTSFLPCYIFCSIVLLFSLVSRFRHGTLHFFAQLNHKKSILEVREFLEFLLQIAST